MATVKIVVLKHQEREDKTWNVKIRITHERKSAYLATHHYVGKEFIKSTKTVFELKANKNLNYRLLYRIINRRKHFLRIKKGGRSRPAFMPSLKLWEVQNVIHYASGEYHDNFAFALPITMCLVTKIIEPVQQIFVTFPLSIGSGIWRRSTVGFFKSLPLGFGVSSSVDVGRLNGYMTKDVPDIILTFG